ncbi:hypothetical protein VR010_04845 [Actinomycetaceae bacterium L2_0104]
MGLLGRETHQLSTFDELVTERIVVQDASPALDVAASYDSIAWDSPGFFIVSACGNGKFYEESSLLEFVVLRFAPASLHNVPLLSALASLRN